MSVCMSVSCLYSLALHLHLVGVDVKVYLVAKPNLVCNLGLLCILEFTISLPH